jgi:hypothetical protein
MKEFEMVKLTVTRKMTRNNASHWATSYRRIIHGHMGQYTVFFVMCTVISTVHFVEGCMSL